MNNYEKILSELNAIQIIEFKEYLSNNIQQILSEPNGCSKIIEDNITNKYCPCCGTIMSRNGHSPNGTQKYICSYCGETNSSTSNTVTYHSKKTFAVWRDVIDCMIDNLSIRKIAKKIGINRNTVFSIRHKVFNALSTFLDSKKLSGEIEGDEQYKSINLKGMKEENMPRYSKKRKSSGLSGISHHKVCLATLFDSFDWLRIKVADLGPITNEMLEITMGDFIEENSLLITDSKTSYIKFCENHNLKLEQIPSGFHSTENGYNIQELNGIHSQLNSWLSNYRGVSTKHLQGYLDWLSYIFILSKRYEYNKMKTEIYHDLIINSKYIKSLEIFSKEFPINLKDAYEEYHYGIFA